MEISCWALLLANLIALVSILLTLDSSEQATGVVAGARAKLWQLGESRKQIKAEQDTQYFDGNPVSIEQLVNLHICVVVQDIRRSRCKWTCSGQCPLAAAHELARSLPRAADWLANSAETGRA